jgi:hypothetical protein
MFTYKLSDICPYIIQDSNDDETLKTSINIVLLAKKYDVLRFASGYAGFAYKYSS